MKLNFKKISILGLVAIFVASAILCCCLSNAVQAEEPVPPCHQTSNETDSSHTPEECDCEQTAGILAQKEIAGINLVASSFSKLKNMILPYGSINKIFQNSAVTLNHQGPPKTAVYSLPIYIQNSNLQL